MKILSSIGILVLIILILAWAFGNLEGIGLVIAIGVLFPIAYIFGTIYFGRTKEKPVDDEAKNNRFDKYN